MKLNLKYQNSYNPIYLINKVFSTNKRRRTTVPGNFLFQPSSRYQTEIYLNLKNWAISKSGWLLGRMYLSTQYCCFYSNIFGWANTVKIPWKEIISVTKELHAYCLNVNNVCSGSILIRLIRSVLITRLITASNHLL